MAVQTRPLHLRSTVAVPQVVVLPARLARALDVPRRLTISKRNQEAPEAVHTFLRGDPRFAGWFEDAPVPSPEGAAAPVEPDGGAEVDPDETWSEEMVVPVLREYAKRHGVELSSADNKPDILTKLRAAREAFEVKADEGKAGGE